MKELNRVEQEERSIRLMKIGGVAGVAGGLALGEVIHFATGSDIVTRLLVDGGLATAAAILGTVFPGLITENQPSV